MNRIRTNLIYFCWKIVNNFFRKTLFYNVISIRSIINTRWNHLCRRNIIIFNMIFFLLFFFDLLFFFIGNMIFFSLECYNRLPFVYYYYYSFFLMYSDVFLFFCITLLVALRLSTHIHILCFLKGTLCRNDTQHSNIQLSVF